MTAPKVEAVSGNNIGMGALIATGCVSVISSVTIFAVILLGLRARDKKLRAKQNKVVDHGSFQAIPKWNGSNVGTVRSLSSISRVNPTFDDDNISMISSNTDSSGVTKP